MFGVSEIPREALQKSPKKHYWSKTPTPVLPLVINSQQMCEICSRKVKIIDAPEATNASLESQADKMLKRSNTKF